MDKLWCFCTMNYYSPIKMNELQLCTTDYANLNSIMLSKRNHSQKGYTYILNESIYRIPTYRKCKPENTSVVTKSW